MKAWALCIGAGIMAGVANAACAQSTCGSAKCLGAIGNDAVFGESFCSSWLSLAPVTTTVTEAEAVTSTRTNLETTLTTVTVVTGTTTLSATAATTVFQKRVFTLSGADPAATIVSQCSSNDARVSSACSCFLSTTTTSTVTVVETAVSTVVPEVTNTIVETVTSNVLATTTAPMQTVTIPPNVVVNGGFEGYLTTGDILPWVDTVATTGGRFEVVNGVNPCTSTGYCSGGRIVVRVYPPTAGSGYTGMSETFSARPSTTYAVSFLYRCLNFDTSSGIDVYYAGVRVGRATCPAGNSAAFNRATGIQFTTDTTGAGELQIRFNNPTNLPYLYYYADDFQAIAV
ncbi:hypothetical protein C8A00DRAFT_43541 [Chaetomidium leptoderma]|uniref:Uncharacterized protein n=1 Tax=Chaetomidium leptoderma TaxID=669021 RepID=A0AAN6ZX96_9PEZI|nr:hypothetical protein C8A00DRAFT_43541 [Chaetomidium leptoderma]